MLLTLLSFLQLCKTFQIVYIENDCCPTPQILDLLTLMIMGLQVVKRLAEVEDWDDQLTEALRHVQSQLRTTAENVCVKKALTYLKNHLTALTAYQPPKQLLRACVHLIRHKGATEFSCGGLEQVWNWLVRYATVSKVKGVDGFATVLLCTSCCKEGRAF